MLLACLLAVGTWALFLANRAPLTDAALRGYPLDDAWIHMVYARALVEEGGFHYNAGVPEAGMTSPLWVLLLAGIHALAGKEAPVEHVVLGAKLLALAFGLAGVWALYRLARAVGENQRIAFLAAALFALDPSLTFSRAAGMEVPLFTFLVILALLAAVSARPAITGAAFGLSVVARPEGVVLLPLLVAIHRWGDRTPTRAEAERRHVSGFAAGTLFALLPGLAYVLFCLHATGSPFSNTFYAKFEGRNPLSARLLSFGWKHYIQDNLAYFTLGAGAGLAVLGAIRLARRHGLRGLAPILGGGLLFVAALASRQFAPGHFYYWERWVIPAFPFLLLTIASGVGEVGEGLSSLVRAGAKRAEVKVRAGVKVKARRGTRAQGQGGHAPSQRSRRARVAWGAAAAAALGLATWSLPRALSERAEAYAWNNQNIEEMNVALGRWIASDLPPEAVVAVNDAGALRYFGMRRTVDLHGLNEHRMLRIDPAGAIRTIRELGVDHFVLFPHWFRGLQQRLPIRQIHQVASPHYTICEGPQDTMVVGKLVEP